MSDESISIDFTCVNCDQPFVVSKYPTLYCSPRCKQDAHLVRYARACIKDGRINDPLVYQAIRTREAFAYSEKGYYDEKARRLSSEVRKVVTERDKGLCRICGDVGTEIDHIDGDSSELDNLQLLCDDCHNEKTEASMVVVTPEHERYEEIMAKENELRSRIDAPTPLRPCDDDVNWDDIWQQLMARQRQLLRQIKEDVKGAGKNRDPIEEEWIRNQLYELKEIRSRIDDLEPQKQARIDRILTPELQAQLKAIETEFSNYEDALEEAYAELDKKIKERVKQYKSSVKGHQFHAIYSSRVTWDTKGLEEYSKTHPEILQFRREGKSYASIRPVKNKVR